MSKTIKGRLSHLDKYIQKKWDEHYWNFIIRHKHEVDWDIISTNPNFTWNIWTIFN